jgi:hypothetical protein
MTVIRLRLHLRNIERRSARSTFEPGSVRFYAIRWMHRIRVKIYTSVNRIYTFLPL